MKADLPADGQACGLRARFGSDLNADVSRLADEADAPWYVRTIDEARAAAIVQLECRADMVFVTPDIWPELDPAERRLLVHNLVANLLPHGTLVTGVPAIELMAGDARACALRQEQSVGHVAIWTREPRTTIHDLVADARAGLLRVTADELADRIGATDAELVVLDTRTRGDRERDGVIAGSIHTPRSVLEWLVDPGSGYTHPAIRGSAQRLVVVCNEGYSSSLAASTLRKLGFAAATDLVGGISAWRASGHPLVAPDSHHESDTSSLSVWRRSAQRRTESE